MKRKKLEKTALFLIALGPTATVLAYDLFKSGYQAIDAGHVDVEYEWWRMGAKRESKAGTKICKRSRQRKTSVRRRRILSETNHC
mgnify:CR=1 FL=1